MTLCGLRCENWWFEQQPGNTVVAQNDPFIALASDVSLSRNPFARTRLLYRDPYRYQVDTCYLIKRTVVGYLFRGVLELRDTIRDLRTFLFYEIPYALGIICVQESCEYSWKNNIFCLFRPQTRRYYLEDIRSLNKHKPKLSWIGYRWQLTRTLLPKFLCILLRVRMI